jgi:AraC-like DNA-binding protein
MPSKPIDSRFADDPVGSEWEESSPRHCKPPKRAGEDEDGADAVLIFERGVVAVGPHKVAAVDLGMSESHLADHLRGDRTIAFHRVVRMCRKNQDAALAMLTELARLAGLAPPQIIKMELTPEQKKEARRRYVHKVRAVRLVHAASVNELADEMGLDAEQLDEALGEVTGEVRFGK